MKIAVFHDLPSGGAKRTLFEMVKRLSKGYKIHSFSLSTADDLFCDLRPYVSEYKSIPFSPNKLYKSPLGRLNQLQRWRDLRRLNNISRQIASEIDAGGYDVVFAHPCMWTQAPLILLFLRTPTVYYCQEPPRHLYETANNKTNQQTNLRVFLDKLDPLIGLYRKTALKMDWQATRKAHLVLVNSKFMQDTVTKIYGIKPEINYLGIDTRRFHSDENNNKDNGFALSVGAIQPTKGFDFIIESLAIVPENYRPSLWIVGNKENHDERQRLNELAETKGVNLIIEVGVTEQTLIQRYNEASIFAYSPLLEPFGLAPLEAMACGTPVVAVAEGGILETVLNNKTGLLVERNPEQFAEAIQLLLKNRELRRLYAQQAQDYVQSKWSWEETVAKTENFLRLTASELTRPCK